MAKWYGKIGYIVSVEKKPGVWKNETIERNYYGDIIRNTRKLQTSEQLNDNINIANEISIVADPFAYDNIYAMRYIEFVGSKWKISDVEVKHPRLILTIGGVYNGES